jgi:hypothetical protein
MIQKPYVVKIIASTSIRGARGSGDPKSQFSKLMRHVEQDVVNPDPVG